MVRIFLNVTMFIVVKNGEGARDLGALMPASRPGLSADPRFRYEARDVLGSLPSTQTREP